MAEAFIEKANRVIEANRAKDPNMLFCIYRSKNSNVVVYSAKRGAGGAGLLPGNPIDVFWIM